MTLTADTADTVPSTAEDYDEHDSFSRPEDAPFTAVWCVKLMSLAAGNEFIKAESPDVYQAVMAAIGGMLVSEFKLSNFINDLVYRIRWLLLDGDAIAKAAAEEAAAAAAVETVAKRTKTMLMDSEY